MSIYEILGLPVAARIDRVVPKKQFYDNGNLSPADKKLFNHVEKIYWRYALKRETTYIQPLCDEEKYYPEIEVLAVKLKEEKQLNRLSELIMRTIPYPMLLFFTLKNKVRLYMGILRQSQANSERMTLVAIESTEWLVENANFWQTIALKKMMTANFCALYEAWFDAISKSRLTAWNVDTTEMSGDEAREKIQRLNAIEKEMSKLRNQMKKESQFNRKMEINTWLQNLKREKNELTK